MATRVTTVVAVILKALLCYKILSVHALAILSNVTVMQIK